MKVAHVAEEVLGGFRGGFNGTCWSKGGAGIAIGVVGNCGGRGGRRRGWRVANFEGWNHDEEKRGCKREDDQEVRVQASKGVQAQK